MLHRAILVSMLFFSSFSFSENLISEDETEILFFQSYHCSSCYEAESYISAWDILKKDLKVRRVPVFYGQKWFFGARMFFLLEQAKEKMNLTSFERRKAAYSVVANTSVEPTTPQEYMKILKEYGLVFTVTEFMEWWDLSDAMLNDVIDILVVAKKESDSMVVPFVRVSKKNKKPTYISLEEPKYGIGALNGELL